MIIMALNYKHDYNGSELQTWL